MGILDVLYSIIINPLILLFDIIFTIVLNKILYVGWSIVILSLIVNILVLPLYNRADELQAKESEKKNKLKKWEDHIKKHFKGDEKFMMLQTYYRQNDYKPYHTLRGALPLLLEIPFFIAAYQYLSSLQLLNGYSFGPIKNLAVPDQMITISGVTINVMPFIMTGINIVSSFVYNRSYSFKDKIQLYVIACVFLVLLYNSPSGLVLYWTCNNIFSLFKNLMYRFFIKDMFVNRKHKNDLKEEKKDLTRVFIGASLLATILIGLFVPGDLISDSVDEFINPYFMINPALYLLNSLFIAFGFFFVWFGVYYYLMSYKGRVFISWLISTVCICGFLNYLTVPFESSMTQFITVDEPLNNSPSLIAQAVGIIAGVSALMVFIIKYKKKSFGYILIFITIPFMVFSIANLRKVYIKADNKISILEKYDDYPEIHFSKNGKNVVVIMMDRMISYYIPYIMNEKPELKASWDGFVYYPNCISYGSATNVGSPALFGGYDYTPEEINKRSDELLKDKQNEAISVMPVLFGENGFDVTVGNPTFANYEWTPDLSIYDKYTYIYKYNTGAKLNPDDLYYVHDDIMKRNLVLYGVYRVSPVFLQSTVYNGGFYNSSVVSLVNGIGLCAVNSLSKSNGISEIFFDDYNVLCNLSSISTVDEDDNNHFNMLSNNTTHEVALLEEPEYSLSSVIDNTEYDSTHKIKYTEDGDSLELYGSEFGDKLESTFDKGRVISYHTNMVAMIRLGEWFDYLKNEGVYDNTKIIIVSDHGYPYKLKDDLAAYLTYEDGSVELCDMLSVQSTLLVKDFNSKGFTTNNSFMTNADVPTIATDGLVENPKNPFTGNVIDSSRKAGDNNVVFTSTWKIDDNNGYTFNKSQWYSVHDNIFDNNNWTYIGAH